MTGFQSMFAAELVTCIRDGRHPTVQELCRVADRIRQDVQGHRSAFKWRAPANPAFDKAFAFRVAQTALTGNRDIAIAAQPAAPCETPPQS